MKLLSSTNEQELSGRQRTSLKTPTDLNSDGLLHTWD